MEPHIHTLRLEADAESAFEAFTARMSEWWPEAYTPDPGTFDGVSIEPEVGGRVLMRTTDGSVHQVGEVTAWDPGVTYAQTWTLAQDPDAPSSLTVRFSSTAEGCEVVVEHGGWHDGNAAYREKFGGWALILERYGFIAST
ncbi:MAG: SRPBCC domain-containing protein [Nocardioides sp.]